MLGTNERHQHRPFMQNTSSGDRHVTGRAHKELGQHRSLQQPERTVDEQEVDVLLDGHPHDVACRRRGDERRRARRDPPCEQPSTALLQCRSRFPEAVGARNEPGQDQLLGRAPGQWFGQLQKRVEPVVERHD